MAAPKHGTLAVNGVRLHYAEQGSGNPVLFLHGFPEYWGAWRGVMNELGDRFRTVAVDTRGINLSEGPKGVDGYRRQSSDPGHLGRQGPLFHAR